MNTTRPAESNLTAYFAGVLGALLIVALLVWSIALMGGATLTS